MKQYVDSCLTYEILLQDSGLTEKPREDWNTFVPQSGDIAHVDQDEKDYIFNGEEWIEYVEEEPESEEMISGNIDLGEETPEIESQDVFVSDEPLPEEPTLEESVNVEEDSTSTLEDSQDTNEEEPVSEEPSSEEEPLEESIPEEPVPEEVPDEELVEGE